MGYKKHLKVRREAERLGFHNLPRYVLYGQPKNYIERKSKLAKILDAVDSIRTLGSGGNNCGYDTDISLILYEFLAWNHQITHEQLKMIKSQNEYYHQGFYFAYGFKKRTHKHYYLVPGMNLYIELESRARGLAGLSMKKWAFQLNIYTSQPEVKNILVKYINSNYEGGYLSQIENWPTIEKYWNVNANECTIAWNKILNSN